MARSTYLTGEAFTNLRRNLLVVTGAVLAVFVSLALAFGAIVVKELVRLTTLQWQEGVNVIVYLEPETSAQTSEALFREVQAYPVVETATFVDQVAAYAEFQEIFANRPALIDEVDPSILPPSIRVELTDIEQYQVIEDQLAGEPAVKRIYTAGEAINKLSSLSRALNGLGLLLAVLLGVSSVILIANTIRLAIYARREEVGIMRLVGASNWFIQVPYVLEGLIEGLVGAGLAVASVFLAQRLLEDVDIEVALVTLTVPTEFLVRWGVLFVLFGAAAGVLGSLLGLRRFLRV